MIYRKDHLEDIERTKVIKSAFELGVEVGERGHMENVGWVSAELKHLIQEAKDLGVTDIVKRRYEFGKEKGRLRREGSIVAGTGGRGKGVKDGGGVGGHAVRLEQKSREQRPFAERVSSEEAIWSTVSVMRFIRGDEEMQSHLSNLFAGLTDLHDQIMLIEPEAEPKGTFDKALNLVQDTGWVSEYEVKFFNEKSAMANIEASSLLARSFGTCDTPMCSPLSNILETVGLKTFDRPVLTVEEGCIAQGREKCSFKLFPREVPVEEGI